MTIQKQSNLFGKYDIAFSGIY